MIMSLSNNVNRRITRLIVRWARPESRIANRPNVAGRDSRGLLRRRLTFVCEWAGCDGGEGGTASGID